MGKILTVTAIAEAGTGLALLVAPSLVGSLLLGESLSGPALPVARVAGIALLGLAAGCWPGSPALGMLIYGSAVAAYLAYAGLAGEAHGALLWPVERVGRARRESPRVRAGL